MSDRRFVIYGAGAVGGSIGAELARSGRDVVLIARGAHGVELARSGLCYCTPEGEQTLRLPVVTGPEQLALGAGDVVVLSMKVQDTAAAVSALAAAGGDEVAVVCAQNGVAAEAIALRSCARVYSVACFILASHLRPGEVVLHAAPVPGVFHLGRFPAAAGDDLAAELCAALAAARFRTYRHDDVAPYKYAKLLRNLINAAQAVLEPDAVDEVTRAARAEGAAVLAAAGIAAVSEDELGAAHAGFSAAVVPGHEAFNGSTWQSLSRGVGSVETDYLAGEIVLLGRRHGVPTPVNAALQAVATEMAAGRSRPATMRAGEFHRRVELARRL